MIVSPSEVACLEILDRIDLTCFDVGTCSSEAEVRALWQIDKVAYGDHSLELAPFLRWWERYPLGSRNLLYEGEIVASVGIYPIGGEQAQGLKTGELCEGDLLPVSLDECQANGCPSWYLSGLVVCPDWQRRGLAWKAIRAGIGGWLATNHATYPVEILGLAQTSAGRGALARFGLELFAYGESLPDGLDLYRLVASDPVQVNRNFKG